MSSDRARFQYTHTIGKETIRLVRILGHREKEDGPLRLALEEHAITNLPAYRALSYTWGPPASNESPENDAVTVLLEDQDFDVFSNLHDALLWMRARGSCDLYWIDAISINQADDVERGVQVGIMDQIYKLAVRVDIWLGAVTEEHRPAEVSRLLHTMAANAGKESLYKPGKHLFDPGTLRRCGLQEVPDDVWYAFVAFFDRKWFSRVWVVQEVALSKDACVLWGDDIIPWETVALCTDFLFDSHLYEQLSEVLYDKNPAVKDMHVGSNSAGIVSIQRCGHDALGAWDSVTLNHIVGASGSGIGGRTVTTGGALLFLMLHLTIGVEASDPRDQVFGLLGILNLLLDTGGRPRTGLEPNYCGDSTAVKVYTETAVFIMEECGNLALLTAVADDADRQVKGLPTWVPDFSANGPSMFLGVRWPAGAAYFDACRSARAEYGVVDGGGLLQVRGFCVGTVSLVGKVYSELAARGSFASWADFLLECDPVYKPTRQCRVEAFWRTLIVDRDGAKHPAPGELRKAFGHWITDHVVWEVYCALKKGADAREYVGRLESIRELATSDVSKTVPSCDKMMEYAKQLQECSKKDEADSMLGSFRHRCQAYINLAFETLWERRPFLTDSGYLGLGGRSIEEGDGVWVVAGCPSPLVLREVPVSSITGPFCYRLVGEAYVHGIMHGEALDDGVQWEEICMQ